MQLKSKENKSSTLTKTAYTKIKEAIVQHKLAPGEILSENELADSLEMSRTPIREALRMLQRDNLVEVTTKGGTFVKKITEEELRDLYSVRISLEKLALESAINYIDEDEVDEAIDKWMKMKENIDNSEVDWEMISKADNDFHKTIISKSHNSVLIHVYDILRNKIMQYQILSAYSLGSANDTINQHLELLTLLKEKNIDKMSEKLEEHIHQAMLYIVKKI